MTIALACTAGKPPPGLLIKAQINLLDDSLQLAISARARAIRAKKTKDLPLPENAPQTTVLRGRKWGGVDNASGIAPSLDAGTGVRAMGQHAIDERKSEWLDEVVHLDRRDFVFQALQAPIMMLLTEALVKDMFGRSIEAWRLQMLSQAFKMHLGLEKKFVRS